MSDLYTCYGWYCFFSELMTFEGPVTIDTGVIAHAKYSMNAHHLDEEMEVNDTIIIGTKGQKLTYADIQPLMTRIVNQREYIHANGGSGRSYYFEGLRSKETDGETVVSLLWGS